MKKLLFFIAFTVLVLPLNAQVQDSMSREAKIYTEEADLVYDHVSESYIGKKAYKRKYGKRFFHDVKRLSKVVHDAPEYTQEQFLRAVALYQISIDKNYETIQGRPGQGHPEKGGRKGHHLHCGGGFEL